MRPSPPVRVTLAALLAVPLALFAGCDSAGPSADASALTNQEAAVVVAGGLALNAGGALDAVAMAALAGPHGPGDHPGCERERAYDPGTQTWTRTVACERSAPGGRFFARFGRTETLRFFGPGGAPQQSPEGAEALDLVILDGYREHRTPALHHLVHSVAGSFDVAGLQDELVTVNGTYAHSATDTLRIRRRGEPGTVGLRTLTYDLDATLTDVRGPRREHGRWGRPVSGTLSGTIAGTTTVTRPSGQTHTQAFERAFTITFGGGGAADGAVIRVGGETFRADLATGEVQGAN